MTQTLAPAIDLFETRTGFLAARGIDLKRVRFSTAFGRGFDYYTGFVFELTDPKRTGDPLVAGGRYDGLFTRLGSRGADRGGRLRGVDRAARRLWRRGMSAPLVLAVPAKGRLQENAEAFFARSGLNLIKPRGARDYRGAIAGLDGVEVAYLSASEITSQLAAGAVHLGVTGEDLVREMIPDADSKVVLIEGLGFGFATVVVAVPQAWIDVRTMADIDDVGTSFRHTHGRKMRVATKYINLTREYFSAHGIVDYRIVESTGATEGAPAAGTAELIVDITTTGATLAANGLKIVEDGIILRSQANLVAARGATWGDSRARDRARDPRSRRGAAARPRLPRSARALCRLRRQAGRQRQAEIRRRNAVRRADLVGHADAALPARSRSTRSPVSCARTAPKPWRWPISTTCSRATIRFTPSSKRRCSAAQRQFHLFKNRRRAA